MPTIKIDDIAYDLDSLTDQAMSQLQMLHVTEQEIQRLQLQLNIAQTARNANAQALKAALPTPLEQVMAQRETLRVS
jgi:hypothetical protein